jgi:hypothetical protein
MPIENVIATRKFTLDDGRDVIVYMGKPRELSRLTVECQYQIVGIGDEKIRHGMGMDDIQAIWLALNAIATDLYTSTEAKNGTLSWEGASTKGNFGLPVPDIISDLVPK